MERLDRGYVRKHMADYSEAFSKMAATIKKNQDEFSGAFVISFIEEGNSEPTIISGMLTDMRDPVAILALIGGQIQVAVNELENKLSPGYTR